MLLAHPREILVDDESPSVKTNSIQNFVNEDLPSTDDGGPCHVEYQVMKRVVGHCMKLGRSARGCVAGNYLHPFHPECM